MKFHHFSRLSMLGLAAGMAVSASAGTFNASLPEFSGDGTNTTQVMGTFNFVIPAGESTVYAMISGMFGNSVTSSTSVHDVYADGILVASCPTKTSFCWQTGPQAWSYTFTGAELSIFDDGQVVMTSTQTDCCVVREGAMELVGRTAPVPEPETYALMLAGLGALALVSRRRS